MELSIEKAAVATICSIGAVDFLQVRNPDYIPRHNYTGEELRQGFLEEIFEFQTHQHKIGYFVGTCEVLPDGHMLDRVDIENDDPILADNMLHWIIEFPIHFGYAQEVDLQLATVYQRLFARIVGSVVAKHTQGRPYKVEGDDIYLLNQKAELVSKLSVSIATIGQKSILIHFGVNLTLEGTPTDRHQLSSLCQLGLVSSYDRDPVTFGVLSFANEVTEFFAKEVSGILEAMKKVNTV